jgi:hypothetical protein
MLRLPYPPWTNVLFLASKFCIGSTGNDHPGIPEFWEKPISENVTFGKEISEKEDSEIDLENSEKYSQCSENHKYILIVSGEYLLLFLRTPQ